jgi:DNA-binding CsgD family transcriptional regulator/tetratricopeptide (TPR) repeat protein
MSADRSVSRYAWTDSYERLSAADRERPLDPGDLEQLAAAAYLIGRDDEAVALWTRAHQGFITRGQQERAARSAFWLAFGLLHKGDHARGAGWVARARRLLDDSGRECVERGYLLLPAGMERIGAGDLQRAHACFCEAADVAERFADADLTVLARHSRGRVLIRMGETAAGVALLDEAMAAVEAGDVSPIAAGDVYCSVIEGCLEIFDVRRAREWTAVLAAWCESQPDLVPYRGQCCFRRAEILQLQGAWSEALDQARQACQWLTRPPGAPAAGAAFYQRGELHRLRGERLEAEAAYRRAHQLGRSPQPGLALLRLAEGRTAAAALSIRRAVDEAHSRAHRIRLLPAAVDIMLAAGDPQTASAAAGELQDIARDLGAPLLHAVAAQARAAVLLAQDEFREAADWLRQAWTHWQELDVPYEAARVRVLIWLACRGLGDEDGGQLELDAARTAFEQLGARSDLARLDALTGARPSGTTSGLTRRERQVLRLVAAGATNKAIGEELSISGRTVERHVSNIFDKLGVSSRAAATAAAYERQLL